MADHSVALGALEERAAQLAEAGKTPIFVAVDGRVEAVLGVADTLKPESGEAVAQLEALGLEVWMLTGDNRATAEAIAREVGIGRVLAEVLPHEKAEKVKALQAEGKVVARSNRGAPDHP